jgi:V/A-type H+/Na+-transporting ATPase subunit B
MPAGDITHPVPDLTCYITEGQLVLAQELEAQGIYPPFDALGSLSRLMRLGAGPGRTRDDHLEIAAQLYALVARARQVADLADVVGADALGPSERRLLEFAEAFRRDFLSQGKAEAHSLDGTLQRAWRVASLLPRRELSMVSTAALDAHYQRREEDEDAPSDAAG